jgi:hypothetical protein
VSNERQSGQLQSNQAIGWVIVMRKQVHMSVRRTTVLIAALACGAVAGTVRLAASDMIGVYAVIEKVVFEPAQGPPERVQIWGAFATADTRNNDDYGGPQKGYFYFSCPASQLTTCRNEWADLQAVAGKGAGVGFGARHMSNGRVRSATDKPESPDPYPIKMGVVKTDGRAYQPSVIVKLKAALAAR